LRIPVLGAYADAAPYGCPKSKRILDAGCRCIAQRLKAKKGFGIDDTVNALALLASGKPEYVGLVADRAHRLAPPDLALSVESGGMAAWHWGYRTLFLTEYYLATGDKAVLPAIREYATAMAKGQSGVGTWGHGMAWSGANDGRLHGRLGGYGALNQAGLVCHLAMILARKCGVRNDEIEQAIGRANRFFGFYVGKGAIPYGDHRPGWKVHDDNGKNSIAAIIFDLQDRTDAADFFSRMTVASYGERERGHTGNYFSFLWGPLGAARAGPKAAAAFLEKQRWYYDLARRWDGGFPYQGGAAMGGGEHKYANWDCTGAYVLAYALPLKKLYITGKGTTGRRALTGNDLNAVVEAGRGFSSWHMGIEPYKHMSQQELLARLGSWSPAVRHRAAQALAEKDKDGDTVRTLVSMLGAGDLHARYGACRALGALKGRAASAVPALAQALEHRDLWLRIQAAYALSSIGEPARSAAASMLELAARPTGNDPRQFMQRYLAFCLFYPGGALRMRGLLSRSLEGVDRGALYPAVRTLLQNDDGRARGAVTTVYENLSYEELKPILPAVYRAIKGLAPSGVMFADGVRLRGLKLLAKHRVKEGIPLCLEIMDIERWGKRNRIAECLKILASYGGAAKDVLPQLRAIEQSLLNHREARGLKPQIGLLRQTMAAIESDNDAPALRTLGVAVPESRQ
ncbi:MAG: DUF6288 domain-containing protein, partial [Planctomycetota bacterium]|nr:DUF6288 domain-containing protein [Planctomycetota bacterium]